MDRDDQIVKYLQGQLTPDQRAQFETAMTQDTTLSAEVDMIRSVRAALEAAPPHENSDVGWDRSSEVVDPKPKPANTNRSPWTQVMRYAGVATFAIAAWQLAVVPRIGAAPDTFRTASASAETFSVQVKFADTATIGEITALLAPAAGTISEGPTALGLMRLSFPDEASLAETVEVLNARTDLLELISE